MLKLLELEHRTVLNSMLSLSLSLLANVVDSPSHDIYRLLEDTQYGRDGFSPREKHPCCLRPRYCQCNYNRTCLDPSGSGAGVFMHQLQLLEGINLSVKILAREL